MDILTQTSAKSEHQSIHSSGEPNLKILKTLERVLPSLFPGSILNSSLRLLIFSPFEFSFSGTQVALGQRGMIALAKAFTGFCFLGIGFDNALVIVDCRFVVVVVIVILGHFVVFCDFWSLSFLLQYTVVFNTFSGFQAMCSYLETDDF